MKIKEVNFWQISFITMTVIAFVFVCLLNSADDKIIDLRTRGDAWAQRAGEHAKDTATLNKLKALCLHVDPISCAAAVKETQ